MTWTVDKPAVRNPDMVLCNVYKKNKLGSENVKHKVVGEEYKLIQFTWDQEDVLL